MDKNNSELDAKQELRKKLLKVTLPISMQSLISSSINLVDTVMVGRLGEVELATVGLSMQFVFIFWMVLFGFNGGAITYMAQFYGKGDIKNIRKVTGLSIATCFSIGIIFFILARFFPGNVLRIFTNIPEVIEMGKYWLRNASFIFLLWSVVVPLTALMKATQQTTIPMRISIVVFITNTSVGAILIFGLFGAPKLGILGASAALITSRSVELLLYLFVIFVRKNKVAGPIKEFFTWNKELVKRIYRNTIPTTINEVMWSLGASMYNAAYGRIGITAFAAVQASNTILNLFALACFSLGDGLLILIGEKLGAGKLDEAEESTTYVLKLALKIGIVAGAVLFVASRFIIKLYDLSETGVKYTLIIFGIYSVIIIVKILNVAIIAGVLRAGGDTKYAAAAEIICVWCVGVPLAFLFALYIGAPVYIVVLVVQTEEILKLIVLYKRYRTKRWLQNLVRFLD